MKNLLTYLIALAFNFQLFAEDFGRSLAPFQSDLVTSTVLNATYVKVPGKDYSTPGVGLKVTYLAPCYAQP